MDDHYIFLMRHAEHKHGHLTVQGIGGVSGVSERFAEWLNEHEASTASERTIQVSLTSSTRTDASEVRETAQLLFSEVKSKTDGSPWTIQWTSTDDAKLLCVDKLNAYKHDPETFDVILQYLKEGSRLLVGNDPLVGWLASRLTHTPTAIDRGELICLRRAKQRGKWKLIWNLAGNSDPAKELAEVQEKIKSKMSTAGVFGGLIVGLLAFLLQNGTEDGNASSPWWWASMAAFATSGMLFFATLFLYDSLLMPPRFWGSRFPKDLKSDCRFWRRIKFGRPGLQRPPSSTSRVLQQAMVQIWHWIFTPAMLFTGLGISFLLMRYIKPDHCFTPGNLVIGAGALLVIAVVLWIAWNRPQLGVSD
jgi:hypothetical protein